jgi:hypothetical protein
LGGGRLTAQIQTIWWDVACEEYNFHPPTQHQHPTFKLHKNATFKAIFPNYVQITGFTISYRHTDYDAM